jgi:hypothetical protein
MVPVRRRTVPVHRIRLQPAAGAMEACRMSAVEPGRKVPRYKPGVALGVGAVEGVEHTLLGRPTETRGGGDNWRATGYSLARAERVVEAVRPLGAESEVY